MRRSWLFVLLLPAPILVLVGIYGINYVQLQRPMNGVLDGDSRNAGVEVRVHYRIYVNPSVLVYDLRAVARTNSKIDIFRSFLQFAEKMKEKKFETVELSFRGKTKFTITGEYFQLLGRDYGTVGKTSTAPKL